MKFKILFSIIYLIFLSKSLLAQQSMDNLTVIFKNANNNNKFFVYDYWATWCAPCISKMPSFLVLANTNSDFNFSLITNEDLQKVNIFFDKNPSLKNDNVSVLLDHQGSFLRKYDIKSLPTTVVTNALGEIIWISEEMLTSKTLDSIRNGKIIQMPISKAEILRESNKNNLFSFSFNDSKTVESSTSIKRMNSGNIQQYNGKGITLKSFFSELEGISDLLIEDNSILNNRRFDIKLSRIDTSINLSEISLLCFKLKKKFIRKVFDAYKLQITDMDRLQKIKSNSGNKSSNSDILDNKVIAVNYGMVKLSSLLEAYLRAPVIFEGIDSISVDITLQDPTKINELNRGLRKNGLELLPLKKRMRTLVIQDQN